MLKNLMAKFKALKFWQKAVIVTGVIILGLASSSTETSTNSDVAKPTPTISSAPEPAVTISPSASPTPSESPTPESPIEFRFAALRDLTDMRKDVNDARIGITGTGLGKFYWNVAEITFNMAQLESLMPREGYAARWNQKLEVLKIAVSDLGSGEDELTISQAKSQLNRVLNAIPALEKIAKSLAN
jgi:hypothetical protein